MTDRPKRVQLSRRKGWRMPPGAVKVDRSGQKRWGNPFLWSMYGKALSDENGESQRAAAVADYRQWIMQPEQAHLRDAIRTELRGKDLACWCPPDQPCHADVLLELANPDQPQPS
jgi:hypothetical protein